jgi:Ran GTPase-activating protein (RanGAP) involved in mRNA processing and transport
LAGSQAREELKNTEHGNDDVVVDDEMDAGRGEEHVLDEEHDDDDMSNESISDEGSEDDNDDDLTLLERNDPNLLIFDIGTEQTRRGWEVLGESIGRNTMLKELYIYYEPLSELGMSFFRGFVKNRSIKVLKFFCSNRVCGDLLLYLIPFFINNKSFESLSVEYLDCSELPSVVRFDSLEYALEQFSGLKELTLVSDDGICIEGADKVIKALAGHTGLRKLSLEDVHIGREGVTNLAAMLLQPSCSLSTLGLEFQYNIDDEIANILASGLNGNVTLTELDLVRCTRLTAIGWKTIFDQLKSPSCMIHTLNLGCNHIHDTALPSLMSTLSNNNTIKVVRFSSMIRNNAFLQAMFQFLQSPSCMIESIDLSQNSFDDEKMESLTNALANNYRLKELQLRNNKDITSTGWQTLFQLLQRQSYGLESLDIGSNNLTDETVVSLASAISHGSTLRELDLTLNRDVSSTAWQVLIIALRLHAPALELLSLSRVHSDLTVSLTDFLTDNRKLKKLIIIEMCNGRPDSNCYVAAFTRVVFDTSSILNTYNSNHVIEEIGHGSSDTLPIDLRSLLRINKENSPSQAARIKIINAHFSGSDINTQVFNDMELHVHPSAIAWMGGSKTNDLMFTFLRSLPSVCDCTKRKIKKRKVDETL